MSQTAVKTTETFNMRTKQLQWKTFFISLLKNKMACVGTVIILFFVLIAFIGPTVAPHNPTETNMLNRSEGPTAEHWFGTDNNGRDIFSRILHGARLTLYIGLLSVGIGALAGIILGLISGYYGRWIDTVIMRTADVLLAFPGILLALAIVSALGPSLNNVIIALSIYNIPIFARIVRASTLEVRKLEYVESVRALGAGDGKIIFQHILPNITSPIIVQATLQIAVSIISAAGLSFLGLGAQPPVPEWGAMLSGGRNYMWDAPHITLFPGVAILLVVLGFNLLGDGLRDVLDPRTNQS